MSVAQPIVEGNPRARLSYGWVIVAITFMTTALVLGSRFSLGMFLPYMPEALDASAADVSAAFAVSMIGAAMMQPLGGLLLDRLGGRAVLTLGLVAAGSALCCTSFATQLWHVLVFMGLGSSVAFAAVSPALTTAIVIDWFDKGRGAALGVATSGTKVAMIILPPILAVLIASYGWRIAMLCLGVTIWALIPVVIVLVRNSPNQKEAVAARKTGSVSPASGATLQQALGMPAFWLITISLFANGQVMNLVFIHLPNYMLSLGYNEGIAALALALLAGVGVFGTMATGVMADKIGSRLMLIIMFGARGLSAALVILMPGPVALLLFVVVFGLLGYGAIGVIGILTSQIFGKRAIGAILGAAYVFNQIGGAAGVYSGGLAYELTGNYNAALWLSVATTLVASLVITLLPKKSLVGKY